MSNDQKYAEFFAHFPQMVSEATVDYVTNTVLKKSRYLFVTKIGKEQSAYCTHCRKEYPVHRNFKLTDFLFGDEQGRKPKPYLQHNEKTQCELCKSDVTVKNSKLGRGKLVDKGYFTWYEKSVIDPRVVTARGIYVERDYTGDFYETETMFKCISAYLFEPGEKGSRGKSKQLRRSLYGFGSDDWKETRSIVSEWKTSMARKNCFISKDNICSAVLGTQLQYSCWEKYEHFDLVEFFDLAARYPCIEYLTKLGLRSFVETKLMGYSVDWRLNWRGKTIDKVLRLTKSEVKELRSVSFAVEGSDLKAHRFFKQKGMNLSFKQAHLLKAIAGHIYYDSKLLDRMIQHASTYEKAVKYILKQMERSSYWSAASVLTTWRDYMAECVELGINTQQEHVALPNNLHAAHQKTLAQVKIKRDKELDVLYAKRVVELAKYSFEHGGFFIRAINDGDELFHEGKTLNHCVGRYGKNYANGRTNLFVLRRVDEPDTPFVTVEVINNEIKQAYGKNNKRMPEIEPFLEAFKSARLTIKISKKKRREQPAERLEVAV